MPGYMWFGTRGNMRYVPAPAINMGMSRVGYQTQVNYLNGGAYIRRSTGGHKEYDMSWNLATRESIRVITDYADGVYGDGAIYWADPFVMDTNMLPQSFAVPALGAKDTTILSGGTVRPSLIDTPANNLNMPAKSALYTINQTQVAPKTWVPIPPNYTAWIGAHGVSGTGGGVTMTTTHGPTAVGTVQSLPLLGVNDPNRFSRSVNSTAADGVLIGLGGNGDLIVTSIMVQVLPTGLRPADGGFISGQGHSGCQFAAQPSLTGYNAVFDRVGLSAKLVETQQWL